MSSFTDEVTQCDEGCWSKRNGAIDQVAVLSVLLLSAKSLRVTHCSVPMKLLGSGFYELYQFLSLIFSVLFLCVVN